MTDKDRLIELIKQGVDQTPCNSNSDYDCEGVKCKDCESKSITDHLLANGIIVPPCKVGKTVYCLVQGFENPLKATVNRITVQASGVVISCSVLGYFGQSYMATDFGKTVFLTKEEAEENLKEREGK